MPKRKARAKSPARRRQRSPSEWTVLSRYLRQITGHDLDTYARLIATLKDRFAQLDDPDVWNRLRFEEGCIRLEMDRRGYDPAEEYEARKPFVRRTNSLAVVFMVAGLVLCIRVPQSPSSRVLSSTGEFFGAAEMLGPVQLRVDEIPVVRCPGCQHPMEPKERRSVTDRLVDIRYMCGTCGMETKRTVGQEA